MTLLQLHDSAIYGAYHSGSHSNNRNMAQSERSQFDWQGRTRLRAPMAEDTYLHISSTCLHQVSLASIVMPKDRQGFDMFNLLVDFIVNS